MRKGIIFGGHKRRLVKAKEAGNIITGKLVHKTRRRYESKDSYYWGTYEYEFNGKTKRKALKYHASPPNTINLYYWNGKVFMEHYIHPLLFLTYIAPWLIGVVVLLALGFRG